MHDDDEMNQDETGEGALEALRRVLSDLRQPGPPPLEAIAARARALRRRRRSRWAAAGSAAAAVAITAAVLAAPAHPATTHLGSGPVHVNLADFSVDSTADGRVELELTAKHAPDAPQLARVLAQAGVRAVVRVGAFCGDTIPPSGLHLAIVNVVASGSSSDSSQVTPQRAGGGFWIRPSAIPKNAEVSIGYSPGQVTVGLVAANRPLTCVVSTAVKCAVGSAAGAAATTLPAAATTLPAAATTLPAAAATLPAAATTLPAAATTLPAAAATLPAAATTLPAAAATLPAAAAATTTPATTTPDAATTVAPIGGNSSRSITAVSPGDVATWCEVQALAPSAYSATTTSTHTTTTTTLAPSTS